MENGTLDFLSGIANSQVVWAICCIVVVFFMFKKFVEWKDKSEGNLISIQAEYREESREREKNLMTHLQRSNDAQERTAIAIEGINDSLGSLDNRVTEIERKHN